MSVWKDDWKNGKKADGSEEKSVVGMPGATLYEEPNFEYKPKGYSNNPEDLPKPKTTPETVAPKVTYGYDEDGNEVKTVGMPERPAIKSQGTVADKKDAGGVGTRYLNGAFGNAWALTPEEEEKRLRRMTAVNGARALGDSIMAFANSIYTGKGANSAQMPKGEMPDQMAFVDRVNAARKEAEARDFARKQHEDNVAYRNEQLNIARKKEERAQEAQTKRNEWMDARIADLATKKDYNELRNEKMRLENELRAESNPLQIEKYKAQIRQIENNIRNSNLRTAKYLSGGGTGSKSYDEIVTPDGTYRVPKGFVTANLGGQIAATGVEPTERNISGAIRNKSKEQIISEIFNNWDENGEAVLSFMVNGGSYNKGSNEDVKPGVNANKSAGGTQSTGSAAAAQSRGTGSTSGRTGNTSSGTGTANGGTGTWGSSIKRKKK